MTELELSRKIAQIISNKKGFDIVDIHVTDYSIIADYFVIATGTSNTHVKSLADEIEYELSLLGVEPRSIEGKATGWILLDYSTVVVHIFTPDSREYYNLERLWSDAEQVDISDID